MKRHQIYLLLKGLFMPLINVINIIFVRHVRIYIRGTMDNYILDEIVNLGKSLVFGIIVKIIFTSQELRDEAYRQLHYHVIRIPGIFYGYNLVSGYQVIGRLFPKRHKIVRADYLLGYIKVMVIITCIFKFFNLLAQFLGR
jgi:hypothetical protein